MSGMLPGFIVIIKVNISNVLSDYRSTLSHAT